VGGAICTGGFLYMLLRLDGLVPISDMTGLVEFGGIWKKKGRVFGVPAYHVFRMYSPTEPARLVDARTDVAQYDVHQGNRRIPDIEHVPWLDVVAALDATGNRLYLYCVNRSLKEPVAADIQVAGFTPAGSASISTLHSASVYDENSPEQPDAIAPASTTEPAGARMRHTFPPASVTVIALSK
jgi:alpha-N-arabinofuranosidase